MTRSALYTFIYKLLSHGIPRVIDRTKNILSDYFHFTPSGNIFMNELSKKKNTGTKYSLRLLNLYGRIFEDNDYDTKLYSRHPKFHC